MSVKTTLNYSPNFDKKKRVKNKIKFVILHYTGMKTESAALARLTDPKSKVSAHYYIKKNGEIITLVPDLYIAWHAGKSYWKKYINLNENSIGIEITNPGHNIKYERFSKLQIESLVKLIRFLIRKYNIKPNSILGHSDIAPNRKKDPGEKFPWKLMYKKKISIWYKLNHKILIKNRNVGIDFNKKKTFIKNIEKIGYSSKVLKELNYNKQKYYKVIIKSFQRRFRQELINGKPDKECLMISNNLISK